uniref:Uncharacterized protein n=1 Tax=Arundo donax TaxID=35708 RepID=A0A0A9EMZ6_ARUDO
MFLSHLVMSSTIVPQKYEVKWNTGQQNFRCNSCRALNGYGFHSFKNNQGGHLMLTWSVAQVV